MSEDFVTVGQFAKLAGTTKRTVLWYEERGILHPYKQNSKGYRFYKPEQIIDFQVILLLKKLNFSLEEIKNYLKKNSSLESLFKQKREVIENEVKRLQKSLNNIDSYYSNIGSNRTLVNPTVKKVPSFEVYYIQKEGSYSKIYSYCMELRSYFEKLPEKAVFLVLFEEEEYKPRESKFKVAVMKTKGTELKEEHKHAVKEMAVPSYKALSYVHEGTPDLLSLHWKELEKYARLNAYKQNLSLPFVDVEFYLKTALNGYADVDDMVSELNLPIK
ncbi:MAG: MerR family transcriptional regulator [bacterium]|nr:MerR family transcriptional regulator [bacterium]